jgi:hypothetical protein
MKLATLLLAALTAASFAADTPEDIAKDYREKSAAAVKRVNETLEKAAVPIAADLVKKGDTVGAETVQTQIKDLMAGEIVMTPHAGIVPLTASYSKARLAALEPVQKSTISRIEALLASGDGKKMEVVSALAKVREEVEAGRTVGADSIPVDWVYLQSPDGRPDADIRLKPNGVFEIDDGGGVQTGTWKQRRKGLEIELGKNVWKVTIADGLGTIEREVGTRYMRPKDK